jgi:ureidoglycolate hydrolase
METLSPEPLTPESFAPYGLVLRRDPAGARFQPLFADPSAAGWRVAILQVHVGPLIRIHRHPDTDECFSPLTGTCCVAVAPPHDPSAIRLFRLTEPICIRRHVWHEIVAAGPATVFIAENAEVTGDPLPLNPPIPLLL